MQISHVFPVRSMVFDEPNLVSHAGLVPAMSLAVKADPVYTLHLRADLSRPRPPTTCKTNQTKCERLLARARDATGGLAIAN